MYCGNCNSYIPTGLSIQQCPDCGFSLEQSAKLKAERAERARIEEMARENEARRTAKTYNLPEALAGSFFSPRVYLDVIRRWRGIGALYSMLVIGIGLPIFLIGYQREANEQLRSKIIPLIDQFPAITIQNGKLAIDKPSPYVIRNPSDQAIILVFDTEGNYTDLTTMPGVALVTANQIAIREANGNVRVIPLSPKINLFLTSEMILYALNQFARWWPYFSMPFLFVGYVVGMLCYAVPHAFLGKLLTWLGKCQLDFKALMRVSLLALTPMILLDAVCSIWLTDGLPDIPNYGIPIVYLVLALWFYRRSVSAQISSLSAA